MEIGATVRILSPFADAFPDTYAVYAMEGSTAFLMGINKGFPEGFSDAFDVSYLEVVP